MANFIKKAANNFLGSDARETIDLAHTLVRGDEERLFDSSWLDGSGPIMRFPLDLGDNGRPMMRFECTPHETQKPSHNIFFPCPQGVTYGDGGSYATFDVGFLGDMAKLISKTSKEFADPYQALQGVASMAKAEFDAMGPLGASIIAARRAGAENIATNLEFANKQTMNPRTNSAFSGNTIRNFQFDFKMIGKSKEEVQMIDQIQRKFREFVYAEKLSGNSSFMLKYPRQWTIRFIDMAQNELQYMPKIYKCYLTAVNTVINPSSNTFRREDLSPYEIDVSLQFQETKVLTRDEIIKLERDGDRENEQDEDFNNLIEKGKNLKDDILSKFDGAGNEPGGIEKLDSFMTAPDAYQRRMNK